MKKKLAILQNGDTPQILSTAEMLAAAGYETRWCGPDLRAELQRIGCDTVLAPESMYALGYDRIPLSVQPAAARDMDRCDLFCEIKVRNIDKIRERWPRLRDRICWWRVNGAQPEICPKGGDEVNLTCPVVTACMWYGTATYRYDIEYHVDGAPCYVKRGQSQLSSIHEHLQNEPAKDHGPVKLGDNGLAYVMWPPYPGMEEYTRIDRSTVSHKGTFWAPPYSLCHSTRLWGYGPIIDDCTKMGVRCFGNNSPAGQVRHRDVAAIAANALCLVHLKSVDCPGWALYEAMLSGCPVVTGRLLNSRMLAKDLLIHGETCLEFGVPASLEYGRGEMKYDKCLEDIRQALATLSDPQENLRIGQAGKNKLLDLVWSRENGGEEFLNFCERHWG